MYRISRPKKYYLKIAFQKFDLYTSIYLIDDAFSVKAQRFNKIFTCVTALFFLLRIEKNHIRPQNHILTSTLKA